MLLLGKYRMLFEWDQLQALPCCSTCVEVCVGPLLGLTQCQRLSLLALAGCKP